MTLELIPNNELTFKGPFNNVSTTMLKLSNTGNDRLAYKIKTTAPKRYCVKPNSGFLDAHTTADVQVMLQPQAAGQPDDRSKHKFMVQWTAVASTMTDNIDNFWKQDLKGLGVQDSKLKCVFTDEQSAAAVPNDAQTAADANTPAAHVAEPTNVTENHLQQQTVASTSSPSPSIFTARSPSSVTRSGNATQSPNQDRPQASKRESSVSRMREDTDRLREENEALKERLKQSTSPVRQRQTATNPVAERVKSSQSQGNGPVLFGVPITEQLLLVAFVIALLLGFSFGYFLFSCNN